MSVLAWFGLLLTLAVVSLFLVALHVHDQWVVRPARRATARKAWLADEAVLLGPVSAWVAEGEARAVRDWNEKPVRTIYELNGLRSWTPDGRFVLCGRCEWEDVTLPDSPERHVIRRKRCAEHRPRPDSDLPDPGRMERR